MARRTLFGALGLVVAVMAGPIVATAKDDALDHIIKTGAIRAILATNPPKKPTIKFLLQNSPYYIGVDKGQPNLLARVDTIIAAALKDGSLNRISEHWLNAPLGDPEHPNWVSVK